jgi:hypothetical protein
MRHLARPSYIYGAPCVAAKGSRALESYPLLKTRESVPFFTMGKIVSIIFAANLNQRKKIKAFV